MNMIIDKESRLFKRMDVDFNPETEIVITHSRDNSQQLFKPKWSGNISEDEEGNITVGEGEWVEGATQEEIDELTKPQPQEPTIEERLEQTEELLQTVTMAFTEYVFMQDASDDS